MSKKTFDKTPDGEPIETEVKEEVPVMVPIPPTAVHQNGLIFVNREEALTMAITLLMSVR